MILRPISSRLGTHFAFCNFGGLYGTSWVWNQKASADPEGIVPKMGFTSGGLGFIPCFVTSSSLPVSLDPNDLARLVLAIVMCCSVGFAFGYLGTTTKERRMDKYIVLGNRFDTGDKSGTNKPNVCSWNVCSQIIVQH